jgi:hypothetical protein
MSFDDYLWCRVFDLALFILYNDQVMEATAVVGRRLGIDLGAFLVRVTNADWPARLGQIRDEYLAATKEQLFSSRDECEAFALPNMSQFTEGDLGRNLLYTYRAIAITEALEDVGRLALTVLTEDSAAVDRHEILDDAVRFDILSLVSILDPDKDHDRVEGSFSFDIPSLIAARDRHDCTIEEWHRPVDVVFEMSAAARATRDAYGRAMGRNASGIGRALSRVPIGALKRIARVSTPWLSGLHSPVRSISGS